jgi:hypothetical protein
MDVYNDWIAAVERMSFKEKIEMVKTVNSVSGGGHINFEVWKLASDGYLKAIEHRTIYREDGEHYVYLWKHAWGDPFYVGSGKNYRWTNKSARCNDFYLHLDQADAVVYKILDGVDEHTARLFEKYVSVNLVEAGYTLANGDNNPEYMADGARKRRVDSCKEIDKHELSSAVQNTVCCILCDSPKCDYRVTDKFIMENGADYFSRTYMK